MSGAIEDLILDNTAGLAFSMYGVDLLDVVDAVDVTRWMKRCQVQFVHNVRRVHVHTVILSLNCRFWLTALQEGEALCRVNCYARASRWRIWPSSEMTTFSMGMARPDACMLFCTIIGNPWQQGTCMTTTVTLLMPDARNMSSNRWR